MYRRNSDSKLRDLEHKYATTRDQVLLKQIDKARHRGGLLPHPDTRAKVALEHIKTLNFHCFEMVRDLRVYLDQIFEVSQGLRLLTQEFNERQYIPYIDRILSIRRLTEMEIRDASIGKAPSERWLQLLAERGITMPTQGPLLPGHESSFTPHLHREGAQERMEIASNIISQVDNDCYDWLKELVRLGIFNAGDLLIAVEDDEAVAELLLRIEDTLSNRDLVQEEFFKARLGEDPPAGYQEEFGNNWWDHVN